MTDVGTWTWAQRTHGHLSRRDHLDQLRALAWARVRAQVARGRVEPFDTLVELPAPPDSTLAREATAYATEVSSPALLGHCLRTWLFASALGAGERLAFDPELLYLACVLHDLGLTPAHDGTDPTAGCFAVEGARAAHALLLDRGAEPAVAERVAEAVSLHLNVDVRPALGAEAHLLNRGAALDVIGRDRRRLPRTTREEVLRRHPRDGVADELGPALERQAARRPRSRPAVLLRFGFTDLVRANPLDRPSVTTHGGDR